MATIFIIHAIGCLMFVYLMVCIKPIFTKGIEVDEDELIGNLRLARKLAKSATLEWDLINQNASISVYKVYYEHLDWWACADRRSETRPIKERGGEIVVSNSTQHVKIFPLHPYSEYKVTIKAIIETSGEMQRNKSRRHRNEVEMYFNTSQYSPNVKPQLDNDPVREGNARTVFLWSPPSPLQCNNFNGNILGYQYIFQFVDGCGDQKSSFGGVEQPQLEISNNVPIMNYTLSVYIENESGKTNTRLPLVISGHSKQITYIKKYYTPDYINIEMNKSRIIEVCWKSKCDENNEMRYQARFTYSNVGVYHEMVKSLNNSGFQRRSSSHFRNDYEYCHPFNYTSILSLIMMDNVRQGIKHNLREESKILYGQVISYYDTLQMRFKLKNSNLLVIYSPIS